MRRLTLACVTFTLLFSLAVFAQVKLPKTPVREVTEDYFGTKVTDPYRWLENTADPEVVSWMKSQNDYTRTQLDKIPGRDKLLDRIKSLDNAGAVVASLQVWGGHYFYLKN
jgi:prolyl oligopeptidase